MQLLLLISSSLKSDSVLLLLKCAFLKSTEFYQRERIHILPCNVCDQVFVTVSKFLLVVKKFYEQFRATVKGMGLIMLMKLRFNN